MRRAARTDANHDEVRSAFRSLGYSWWDTFRLGDGFPDGVISGGALSDRNNILVEVKQPGEKLTPAEKAFHLAWPGRVIIIQSIAEVIAFDAQVRRGERS